MNTNRFRHLAAIGTLTMLLASSGCSTPVKPPIVARAEPYQRDQIHLESEDLRVHTVVEPPILSRDDAGLLYVTVGMRATTDQKIYIDYRATFFDRRGQVINQTGWLHKTLPANIPDQFVVNSTSPLASYFQIDVRYSQ